MRKKINLTTDAGIIPNDALDFSRFNKNPVVFINHDWANAPLGLASIVKENEVYYADIELNHLVTKKQLFIFNRLKTINMGGELERKEDGSIKKFILYELSFCCLSREYVPDEFSQLGKAFNDLIIAIWTEMYMPVINFFVRYVKRLKKLIKRDK